MVRHEDGRLLQVGRQCLADFLGHADPTALAREAELLIEAGRLMSEATEAGLYDGDTIRWKLPAFLAVTAMIIRQRGWVSKSKARELWEQGERAVPTVNTVTAYLDDSPPGLRRELGDPSEADLAEADAALEWLRDLAEQEGLGDYLRNVAQLARVGAVDGRTAGVGASILAAYRRAKADAAARAAQGHSEWQGEVGERLTRTVTIRGCWPNHTDWGVSYRTLAADDQGNVYTWYGKTDLPLQSRVTLRAKVKGHDTYKGQRQTVLFYVQEAK